MISSLVAIELIMRVFHQVMVFQNFSYLAIALTISSLNRQKQQKIGNGIFNALRIAISQPKILGDRQIIF